MLVFMSPMAMDAVFAAPERVRDEDLFTRRQKALTRLLKLLPYRLEAAVVWVCVYETPLWKMANALGTGCEETSQLLLKTKNELRRMARQHYPELCEGGSPNE